MDLLSSLTLYEQFKTQELSLHSLIALLADKTEYLTTE
jgi:hypothetical protein